MNYELSWFLRRHAADWHTVSELARELSLPEQRLRRDLRELEASGFRLDVHPTVGFRVAGLPEGFDRDEILWARSGKRIGRRVSVYRETASTNNVALALAESGPGSDGMVVLAEHQTAGRGRQGADWFATAGESLLLSVVVREPPDADWAAELTLAAAVATASAVETVGGGRVGIRWPNDIEIERRKVAGILVERATVTDPTARGPTRVARRAYVVGIGVNVNQEAMGFPPEIADRAGSVRAAVGREVDRILLLDAVLQGLEDELGLLDGGRLDELLGQYTQRSDMVGRRVSLKEGGREFSGVVEAISPHYALVLRLDRGELRNFPVAGVTLL